MATTDQDQNLEQLIESGELNDSTDIGDIVAKLNGVAPKPDIKADKETPAADELQKPEEKATGDEPGDPAPSTVEAKPTDQVAPATDPEGEADADGGEEAQDPSNFKKHPLYGVLSGTRKTLAKVKADTKAREERLLREQEDLRRQNETLQRQIAERSASQDQLQQAADDAGLVDQEGNPIDVSTIDVDKLREDYDGPLVDAIVAMRALVEQQNRAIQDLRTRDEERDQESRSRLSEEVQADIDSIPKLAEWQADHVGGKGSTMWRRALALDSSMREEPDWQNKSRLERFQEITRILAGQVETPPATTPGKPNGGGEQAITAAKKAAAARAAPTSLSELPSGTPAAQSENETFESLDVTQVAAKLSTMTPAQQEALLQRLG